MKYISFIPFFFTWIFFAEFLSSKEKNFRQENINTSLLEKQSIKDTVIKETEFLFDYPDDIVEKDKPGFVKKIKKGKILYGINCSKCHNSTVKGEAVIPDFSLPQLMDYEIRFQYPEHQEDLKETNISIEELDMIVNFLRYKKKSNVEWK